MTAMAIPFFCHLNLYTQISDSSRKRILACRNFNLVQKIKITPSLRRKKSREVDRWPSKVVSTSQSGVQEWPNPTTVEDMIQQARNALESGLKDGKLHQLFQLLLPIDQRKFNFLDTEPRDYPCGIREEFNACSKVVASILQGSEIAGENTDILSKRIGDVENEMDPISVLYPSNKSVAAVVMPISDTLKQGIPPSTRRSKALRGGGMKEEHPSPFSSSTLASKGLCGQTLQIKSLAKDDENRPLLLVNPQWRSTGNIVSDFGFGPWKRQAEEFLNTFESTYILLEQRIGEASNIISSSGGVVRLLKCYPSDWHIYLMAWDGTSDLIGTTTKQPTYKELEQLVAEARKRIPWKSPPRVLGGSEPAPPPLPKSLSGFLSDEKIDQMDKLSLRRALTALNLPTSGRIETLRERLKEAQKNAPK